MKRLVFIALVINAALLAAILAVVIVRDPDAQAQQGAGGAVATSGDVNGSGGIDISDAVFLLNWLFSGGPAPAPCAGGSGLPDTGQTQCYDCLGESIACKSCIGQPRPCDGFTDAFLAIQDSVQNTGCPNDAGRFIVDGNDTVIDNCTGLQWQRLSMDVDGDGQADARPWCTAMQICHDLVLAGHSDWRLPNVRELQSIIDYGRDSPAIDPIFQAEPVRSYWTSTAHAAAPLNAWVLNLRAGAVEVTSKTNATYFRAVRGG